MRILRAHDDALVRPSAHQNWPRDRKLTQNCWSLHWFLGLRADVWQMRLHVYTRLVVTQVWIEKPCNKNIEIGFQNAVFHLSTSVSAMIEARMQRPLFRARENRQSTSYNLRSNLSSILCYKGMKITRLLSFSNPIPFYFYLGHSYSSDRFGLWKKTTRYRCKECRVASL